MPKVSLPSANDLCAGGGPLGSSTVGWTLPNCSPPIESQVCLLSGLPKVRLCAGGGGGIVCGNPAWLWMLWLWAGGGGVMNNDGSPLWLPWVPL